MKILVADDDSVTRRVLKDFLVQLKYEPVIVENGQGALDALRVPDAPTIAILDWMMPDVVGLEVCRQLRALNHEIETYVIILTGKKEKIEIAQALDAGADDVLSKPFNIMEMKARLRVAERHIQRQLKLHALLTTARSASNGHAAPRPIAASPEVAALNGANPRPVSTPVELLPTLTSQRIGELVLSALREIEVEAVSTGPNPIGEMTRASGFTTWTGFVVANEQVWLDLVLEVQEFSATKLFTQSKGVEPNNHGEVMEFLKIFQAAITTLFKADLQTPKATIIAPFAPVATGTCTLRLPEECRRQRFFTNSYSFTLTLALQPCPLLLRKPNQLSSLDILGESYPKIIKEEVVLLNQGAILNDRFIGKIVSFDLSAPVRQPVPIFQPSPLAHDFLALGLPVSGQS